MNTHLGLLCLQEYLSFLSIRDYISFCLLIFLILIGTLFKLYILSNFLWLVSKWYVFFYPFITVIFSVSKCLKCISPRQYIMGLVFWKSDNLCECFFCVTISVQIIVLRLFVVNVVSVCLNLSLSSCYLLSIYCILHFLSFSLFLIYFVLSILAFCFISNIG